MVWPLVIYDEVLSVHFKEMLNLMLHPLVWSNSWTAKPKLSFPFHQCTANAGQLCSNWQANYKKLCDYKQRASLTPKFISENVRKSKKKAGLALYTVKKIQWKTAKY